MRKFTKCLTWLLVLSLCLGMMGLPVFAADTGLKYFFNETVADPYGNGLVAETVTDRELDATQGTHMLLGANLVSSYAPAYVWGKKHSSETTPVIVDAAGREYYLGNPISDFMNGGFYLDDYWVDGVHYYMPEGEYFYARYGEVDHFVLADTTTGEYTTAYCVDNGQNAKNGYYYNIENLEDAGYYNAYQAQKIRAIALTGYWGQPSGTGSLAAMKAALAASGEFTEAELALVTDGVAMTATQYAIWHFANANDSAENATTNAQREKMRKTIGTYWYDGGYSRMTEEQKPAADMVFKIGNYLIDMDPASVENTTANAVITKENFLTAMGVVNAVKIDGHVNNADANDENDAYTADVRFTMGVLPLAANGDDLVAQIVDENGNVLATGRIAGTLQEGEVRLEGSNGTYTFEDLTLIEGTQKLKIQLEGHQELKQGVYLYNPVGGRGTTQTMIGVAEGTREVDVALDWDLKFAVNEPPERIITITKTTPGENHLPLEGIQFDFYCVAGRDEYLSGAVKLPENAADYTDLPDVPDYTIITDSNGQGTFNLTENNLPDGVYLVVEHDHPAIVAPVAPFYVIIPGTTEDGTGLEYKIDIYPKNNVRGDVKIEKDVISIGNNESTQDAYAPHTWIIGTTIPADISQGKSFVISDTLDKRLDYLGNVRVRVETTDGTLTVATLNEGKDYTLTVTDVDSVASGESDSFRLSLTQAGMEKVASVLNTGITHIRVYFDAQINANANMGEEIPNQAELDYTNSVGIGFHKESDEPKVYTGGARLLKVDAHNHATVLPGAEFQLYRKATEAEVGDESVTIEGYVEPMVPVYFYNNATLTGEKTNTAVSDANGNIYVYGLAYGEYYLVETKAPAGYNLLGKPITLTINAESHTDAAVVTVENTSGTVLPETGGLGTELYTIPGLFLLLAAALLLMKKRGAFQR